jgi:hypothetical protein
VLATVTDWLPLLLAPRMIIAALCCCFCGGGPPTPADVAVAPHALACLWMPVLLLVLLAQLRLVVVVMALLLLQVPLLPGTCTLPCAASSVQLGSCGHSTWEVRWCGVQE